MSGLKELKDRLMEDPKYKEFSDNPPLTFQMSQYLIDQRVKHGWTQDKLAKKIGTVQPSIARFERGKQLPSLSFLLKIADAYGKKLILPRFE